MPRVTREELYTQVWQTPMSRLGKEYGISGNGLAKICRRLDIPYPPRGHWAKKEAGKPVVTYQLPPLKEGTPEQVDINPAPKHESRPAEVLKAIENARQTIDEVQIPETLRNLHPKIRQWVEEHAGKQREIKLQRRQSRTDPWTWAPDPLADLTDRDKYRFRVTSALLKAVERGGGTVADAQISGKLVFNVDGEDVNCVVLEKMTSAYGGDREKDAAWTAYPDFHNTSLRPTGYLRLEIKTYTIKSIRPWVETDKKPAERILPEIAAEIIAAGPALAIARQEREEQQRKWEEEQAARRERQRQLQIDERRWTKFRELAADWEECRRLKMFIAALSRKVEAEGDTFFGDQSTSEWIAWAKAKVVDMDPLDESSDDVFSIISNAGLRSW